MKKKINERKVYTVKHHAFRKKNHATPAWGNIVVIVH